MLVTPNLNGTSREALVAQRLTVVHAFEDALKVMPESWPHPRDYQLASEPLACEKDAVEWAVVNEMMQRFVKKLREEAEEIQG